MDTINPNFWRSLFHKKSFRSKTMIPSLKSSKYKELTLNSISDILSNKSLNSETKVGGYKAPCEELFYEGYLVNKSIKPVVTLMSIVEFGSHINDIRPLVFKTALDEAEAVKELEMLEKVKDIPNTLKLMDHFIKDGKNVLVFQKLGKFTYKNLDLIQIVKYMKQLISIVNNLNKAKIVHMDIKPENIMKDSEDNLILIDFGLAKEYNEINDPIEACGTDGYTPPELLEDMKVYNDKLDIYSCGCIFAQMLDSYLSGCNLNFFGSSLFCLSTLQEILEKLDDFIEEKNSARSQIIYDIAEFLRSILNSKPSKRAHPSDLLNHKIFTYSEDKFLKTDYQTIKKINSLILYYKQIYSDESDDYPYC